MKKTPTGLRCEGVSYATLASKYGTPLYFYSGAALQERLRAFRAAFPKERFDVYFAMKANSNPGLLRRIFRAGFGADVVSGGELRVALRAGCPAKRVFFSGVGKSDDELQAAVRARIGSVHIESVEEAERLAFYAKRAKRTVSVGIRLNPSVEAATHAKLATGHGGAKFGLPEDEAKRLVETMVGGPLRFDGASCHIGSQIVDLAPFRAAAVSLRRFLEYTESLGLRPKHADLGGGFAVRYQEENVPRLADYAHVLADAFAGANYRLSVDPGRWLVAPVGRLLSSVLTVKNSGKKTFVVVDAGMTELLRPTLYGAWHRIVADEPGPETLLADVVGPVCESGDFLGEARRLPALHRGSLVCIEDCGAYGYTMASQYNVRPRPAEVLVEGTKTSVLRRRERLP